MRMGDVAGTVTASPALTAKAPPKATRPPKSFRRCPNPSFAGITCAGGSMRTRSRFVASFPLLCLLVSAALAATAAPARAADINRFIDDKTIFAGQADLTKVDPAAIETFLLDLAKSAGIAGGQ